MSRIFEKPIEEIIRARRSVRTFSGRPTEDEKRRLNAYTASLSNPFSVKIRYKMINAETSGSKEKLGTYGMIEGATDFIGAAVKKGGSDMEAVGYEFEKLVLYATSLDLGTCWLGGTFNRPEFEEAMELAEDEYFPAVTPIGKIADRMLSQEKAIRKIAKSDTRKPWKELFFAGDFKTPLGEDAAEEYAIPLEMVRLGPSASNQQPWRILRDNGVFHFYEHKIPGYSDAFPYDIQRVDIGIAACHFELTAEEAGFKGRISRLEPPVSDPPDNFVYVCSWVPM